MANRLLFGAILALTSSVAVGDDVDRATNSVEQTESNAAAAVDKSKPIIANSFAILADISLNVAEKQQSIPGKPQSLDAKSKSFSSVVKRP